MFSYLRKKPLPADDPFRPKLPPSSTDFQPFAVNDVAVKVWIPEPLDVRLTELADLFGVSRPRYLLTVLFIELYGRYELEQMREKVAGLFAGSRVMAAREPIAAESETSPVATARPLGKSDCDLKLWMPAKMRDDIQGCATTAGLSLSEHIRKVFVTHVFGSIARPDLMESLRLAGLAAGELS